MGSTSNEALLEESERFRTPKRSTRERLARFRSPYFLAGTVLVRFHSLRVWSSDTVTRHGSTGWKASARTPSKWLRSVYLGFQVFLKEESLQDGS